MKQQLQEKTIVITGGNDGIGFQTALQLAGKGASLILTGRDEGRMKKAVQVIKEKSGNENIHYVIADYLSFKDVHRAAADILSVTDRIDVLINNVGATYSAFMLTEDGCERTIQTNHLSHFLLTAKLMNALKNAPQARIINVSSHAHLQKRSAIDFDAFTRDKDYFILKAYGQSKLANVLFTMELAERLKTNQITVNAMHPGIIRTDIGKKQTMTGFHAFAWDAFTFLFSKSPKKGAQTPVYLAVSDEVRNVTGKYFSSSNRLNFFKSKPFIYPHRPEADGSELRKKLWTLSEEYCGIKFPA